MAEVHSAGAHPLPPVAWITRQLNEACRATPGEPKPPSELCGEVAEFIGLFEDDVDD